MAQLKSSIVQGSLRVTDTTITNNLTVTGTTTAAYALIAPTSSNGAPTWRALTKADISDFPTSMTPASHTHGNITNDGKIGSAGKKYFVIVGTDNKITTLSTTEIGSGTTKFLREDGSWQTPAYIANAAYGNISTSGTITSTGVALANGDYLLFSDASNNGKIERTSITIGTATNTWLRNDGTWNTPTKGNVGLGNVENVAGNARVFYGTSNTAAGTAAKVVTCSSYDALTAGDMIVVKFDNANTVASPTLNVNSKGAKNIKKLYNGAINNLTANGEITGTCLFLYDGTQWLLANADYNNTYSNQTAASGGTTLSLVTTGEKYTWNNKTSLTIGSASTQAMAGNTTVTNVAITADTTTNASYPLVFGTTNTTAAKTEGLQKNSAKFYVNPSTGNIQATTFNGFTLAAASTKSVVTSIDTSASLPTSNAVKSFVEGKGYVTSSGVTSITLKAGAGITLDTDNTAITSTGTRTISISGVDTSAGSESDCLTAKGTWKPFTPVTGSTSITTLGTITTGTWNGTAIGGSYLGTMVGATSSTAGTKGAVPAPAAGDQGKVLNGAGNWVDKSPLFQYTTTATKIYLLGTTIIPRSGTQTTSTLYTPGDESAERMYMDSTTNTLVAPNATFGGSVTATSFSGSGAGLTNIPASAVANMTGATSSTAGAAGIIPAPAAGDQVAFLQGDATWYKLNARNGTGTGSIVVGTKLFGETSTASGNNSFASGQGTQATGGYTHTEGYHTIASNGSAHAEGESTQASGWISHAEGYNTIANHKAQHVFGEYNIGDTSTAGSSDRGNFIEIVGNGTADNARSNARVLDWYGNEYVAGILEGTNHTWHVNGTSKATSYYNTSDDSIVFIFV